MRDHLLPFAEALGEIDVALGPQQILFGNQQIGFELGELQKEMLANGLDDLGLMRTRVEQYAIFEARDAALRPWVRDRRSSV